MGDPFPVSLGRWARTARGRALSEVTVSQSGSQGRSNGGATATAPGSKALVCVSYGEKRGYFFLRKKRKGQRNSIDLRPSTHWREMIS